MAELEAAAVVAFEELAVELQAHGLPDFASAALQAALEEVGHATQMTRIALANGLSPARREFAPTQVRSLEEVAIDNGGEGCGRELLGAFINRHQAEHATDPIVRATMANIGKDEAAHARLSLELAEALMPRLTLPQRLRVREAQERTLASMAREEMPNAAARTLGLMDEAQLKAATKRILERARV